MIMSNKRPPIDEVTRMGQKSQRVKLSPMRTRWKNSSQSKVIVTLLMRREEGREGSESWVAERKVPKLVARRERPLERR